MPDARERLIEAAVRPFDDNTEMKLAASEMRGVLIESEAPGAEEATARFEAVDGRWRFLAWKSPLDPAERHFGRCD